jgi:hypothetical protein
VALTVTADELELLTAALRLPGPGGGGASASVGRGGGDWDGPAGPGALALADRHDLLPALWRAQVDAGGWVALPPEALAVVAAHFEPGSTQPPLLAQQAYEANRPRVQDLMAQGDAVLDALAGAGIGAVALKGLHALRAGWWPDPVARVMRDLDVLVAEAEAEPAQAVLGDLGYRSLPSGHDAYADHELAAVHLPGRSGSVELHTALVVSRWRGVLPARDVLAAGPPMSTTDAVVHSIAHAQLHDEAHLLGRLALRSAHELAVLAAGPRAGTIDWGGVRTRFAAVGATGALDAQLHLARAAFGAEVPEPSRPLPAAARLALGRWLLARPGWAARYERAVFVPRALSADRMHERYGPGSVWRSRAVHVTRAVRRRGPAPS